MSFSTGREVPHAAVTRRVRAKLKKMSPDELMATFVASGIYTPDGELTRAYGGTAKLARKVGKRR